MTFKKLLVFLLVFFCSGHFASSTEHRTEIFVDFRLNDAHIDPAYSDNALRIDEAISFLCGLANDTAARISSVAFCGSASPEGSYEWNRHLASRRLAALERFIREYIDLPDSIISRSDSYIPWDYLRGRVSESDLLMKDTIISIIGMDAQVVSDPSTGKHVDRRILLLKRLEDGNVWDQLMRRYFSDMRSSSVVAITYKEMPASASLSVPTSEVSDIMNIVSADRAIRCQPILIPLEEDFSLKHHKHLYMGIYTNLLFDALGVPNLGAEFYLGRNFSIAGNWMHAWWCQECHRRYWRLYGGEINLRRWFGSASRLKPLAGHHLGIYAQAFTYDFQLGGKVYMGGEPGGTIFDRAHFGGGVEYGYALPVASRFNIDFSLGVGYAGGRVYEFKPKDDGYEKISIKERRWFGPTKLNISLVWLLGKENVNIRRKQEVKGGDI